MLYDTTTIDHTYTNVTFTSLLIFLTIINNTFKMITIDNMNIISKYTKTGSYLSLQNRIAIENIYEEAKKDNRSERINQDDKQMNQYLQTWKPVQIGLGIGSNLILFLLFIAIVCNANIKLLIATMIITLFCITLHQFFNIYDAFDMETSKLFSLVEMILFMLISTIILISLFDSMWIVLYSLTFFIIYTHSITHKDNRLIDNIRRDGLVRDNMTFRIRYANIIDILNICITFMSFVLITAYSRNISIHQTNLTIINYSSFPRTSLSSVLPIDKKFFFDQDDNVQISDDIKDYLLSINESQVILYTKNTPTGIVIGSYENNRINLPISKNVKIDISTSFYDNKWFSDVVDSRIRFNDGICTFIGPKMNELVEISINSDNLSTVNMENGFIPTPCGDYQLDATLSKLAHKSSLNRISIDIYNSGDNKCVVYQLYYPETDILLGEGQFEEFPCVWLNLNANINGQQVFQLLNGNIMYLSPVAKQYVHIDSTFNLNNNGIFFKFA